MITQAKGLICARARSFCSCAASCTGVASARVTIRIFVNSGSRRRGRSWRILSASRVAAGKSLADHLADFKAALLAKGNTEQYAAVQPCAADSRRLWLRVLVGPLGQQTAAEVTEGGIDRKTGPVLRYGMSGADRTMLYRLAVESGLRAGELRSLTCSSFTLRGAEPSVTLEAAYSKHRRQDVLPLRSDTAALLEAHLVGKMPAAVAFAMPKRDEVIDMLRADLADACTAWLDAHQTAQERDDATKGTFLAYCDGAGRYVDFHALRHTFISNLAAGGVHPKTAQSLARHSALTLTMDRYTHGYSGDLTAALDALPDLSIPAQTVIVATGTDCKQLSDISLSPDLSPNSGVSKSLMESDGVNGAALASGVTHGRISTNAGFPEGKQKPGLLAELADAMDSKSIVRKDISVRLR